ncbi:hypothetical protein BO70DRAFT_299267 [Aspergillus heteromorphus CBS 117.55]|uniref:Spindle pole body-associated protein cut12 domain-containing protein n=1 Tax=Aspergillus heteromorphus CBS 117.55 TaxID=1448321 RepID=A0A317VB90_9EURO|nr:uncharacterized protein BO70DRAFT_299267 [Aspergillus heteromorphus CBS 117.55]PWY70258.1 hypothetical protein BO70DRAFT_299267 [Aspergillus heteromorphus CBS 117.55]
MLGWITGQEDQVADNSRAAEPPETPAPVFAIRAFKSALFGTPGPDDDQTSDRPLQTKNPNPFANQRMSDNLVLKPSAGTARDAPKAMKPDDADLTMNAMASPTKSILVTPGTASNRRKTVSFGDSVVDNERKRDQPSTKPANTPTSSSSNFSSQWSANSSDGKSKPRSKLTQALMDSRDRSSKGPELFSLQDAGHNPPPGLASKTASTEPDDNDDTINLNEPRSQSGKYWKAEFDNYRTKTTWEIKKLIQYRSAAKTYAKKKDDEASRLADKLKDEEIKVAEMERHVTQLASTMVGESAHADKEKLVQDLTKQTALALQYKHRVSTLRRLLERHGVVGNEVDEIAEHSESEPASEKTAPELHKTQQALEQAAAKIEEMKLQQSDFNKLKDLARSSEQKASELQKENASLKQTLARVKQEMSKYEGRRKEKEAKLKQREAKLETRIQEYRERLKTASQQHRENEEDLKESFNEERHRMQEQIDQLKIKLTAIESLPHVQARTRYSDSPRKQYTGVHVHDFGQTSPGKDLEDENTADIDEPPSPSPRAKDRRSYTSRYSTGTGDLDLKRAMKAMGITDEHQLAYLGESLRPPQSRYLDQDEPTMPPSPPPDNLPPTTTTTTRTRPKQKYATESYRSLYTSTNPTAPATTMTSLAHHLANNLDDSHHGHVHGHGHPRPRPRRSPSKYTLDAVSTLPDSHALDRAKRKQSLAAVVHRDSLPMDRKIQAQARLKQRKDDSRKGKENIKSYTSQPLTVLD